MALGGLTTGLGAAALVIVQFIPGVDTAADATVAGYSVYTATDGTVALLSAGAATPAAQAAIDLNSVIEGLDANGAVSAGAASFTGGAGLGMLGGAFGGVAITPAKCPGS